MEDIKRVTEIVEALRKPSGESPAVLVQREGDSAQAGVTN
jgi:hypothetical protein